MRSNAVPLHHLAVQAPQLHRPATYSILRISDRSIIAFGLKLSEVLDVAGEPVHEIEPIIRHRSPRPRPTPPSRMRHCIMSFAAEKRPSHRGVPKLGRLQEPDGLRHHARFFAPAQRRHSLSSTRGRTGRTAELRFGSGRVRPAAKCVLSPHLGCTQIRMAASLSASTGA